MTTRTLLPTLAAGLLVAGLSATAGAATPMPPVMTSAGCTACHASDKKLVGPAYNDVAAKYKGQADAAAQLMKKVREGGKGVWGPIPMPPNPAVPDGDIKKMVEGILKL